MVPSPPTWTQDRLADPHADPDKAKRVEAMFAAIAPSYDLNNRLHSLGLDRRWRAKTVAAAAVNPGDVVLDVACGTGDLTLEFAKGPAGAVLGVDFTLPMLTRARPKNRRVNPTRRPPDYLNADALRLPLADQSVDVVSIAFGIRNVIDPARAVAEFHRVLRPAGRLVILEFSLPSNPVIRGLYRFYFNHVMPRTATLIARDRTNAYRYLPKSVDTFLDPDRLAGLLSAAGFDAVTTRRLSLGIALVYRGIKPQPPCRRFTDQVTTLSHNNALPRPAPAAT